MFIFELYSYFCANLVCYYVLLVINEVVFKIDWLNMEERIIKEGGIFLENVEEFSPKGSIKGQLILKGIFKVFIWTKKQFLP